MKSISISTCFDYSIPLHEQLPLIKDAGFTHVSLGRRYEHSDILDASSARLLQQSLQTHGLLVDSIHGAVLDQPGALDMIRRVADAAIQLSAQVIVLHCSSFDFNPEQYDQRFKSLITMLPALEAIAKDTDIRFALENVMPGIATDLVTNVLTEANPEYIGFCYDSSHDQVDGPRPFTLLEQWKHRLLAVHLSDRVREFVDHVLPGEGFVDFEGMCKVLRCADFERPLLMEVMVTHSDFKDITTFLSSAYQRACVLYNKIHTDGKSNLNQT